MLKLFSSTASFKDNAALNRLPVYSLYEKGEIRRKRTGERHDRFRVSIDVSDAEWDEFPQQARDAIDFLLTNRDAVGALLKAADDVEGYLDFAIWSRLSDEIVNQNDHFPKDLIRIAGDLGIGINMSIYSQNAFSGLGGSTPNEISDEQGGASDRDNAPN